MRQNTKYRLDISLSAFISKSQFNVVQTNLGSAPLGVGRPTPFEGGQCSLCGGHKTKRGRELLKNFFWRFTLINCAPRIYITAGTTGYIHVYQLYN